MSKEKVQNNEEAINSGLHLSESRAKDYPQVNEKKDENIEIKQINLLVGVKKSPIESTSLKLKNSNQESDTERVLETERLIIKERVFESEEIEIVGEDWFIQKFSLKLCDVNQSVIDLEKLYWIQRIRHLWCLICYSYVIYFFIDNLVTEYDSYVKTTFIAMIVLICICGGELILLFFDIYYVWIKRENDNFLLSTIATGFWSILTVVSFIIIFEEIKLYDCTAWIAAVAIASANLVAFLSIVAWVAILPFLLLILGLESLIRLATGKAYCPFQRKKDYVYKYRLYRYDPKTFAESSSCTICLEDYNEDDNALCVLECQVSHVFHEKCIFGWLEKNKECPICRKPAKFML